jgi:DNA uptake protein ComE-like DNA-binding protein
MDGRRIDLNSADLTTLLRETTLDIRKAEVLLNARPFWDGSELRMLPGFGRKTLRDLAVVARVVPPSQININTCAPEDLHALPGVGIVLMRRIVSGRPYDSLDDLSGVQGISRALMGTLRQRSEVVERKLVQSAESIPLVEDLLDLNSCDEADLRGLPLVGPALARRIVAARPFVNVDSLLEVEGIGPAMFPPLRSRVSVRVRNPDERLDVNGCSSQSLQRLRGVGPALAMRVISGRPYGHWDDLLELDGIGPALLERFRQACELASTRPEAVEAELVDDDNWFTEGNFETSPFEAAPGLPQLRDPVMSLVAYESAVEQEIRRRMPLYLSGWVVAVGLIIGMLLLFFSGYVQVKGLIP